ncbi:hypothetical protein Tco_1566701, partial [Tanacetum coccineum]
MPSESPLIKELDKIKVCFEKLTLLIQKNCKRASIFYTSPAEIKINDFCQDQVKPILNELKVYLECFQNLFQMDIIEMKDVFESTESELLKDQLLEASLAEDIKNLVITSCVEIRNKDLHDETERISKDSKDVSNERKIADTVCNDSFEVTQELSKRIVELEKDLFDSVQRSRVETDHCDEVKVKVDFDDIETKNIELEHRVMSLIKENEHLSLTYQSLFDLIKKSRVQTKTSNVTQNEAENL